jgi:hypothetical protein
MQRKMELGMQAEQAAAQAALDVERAQITAGAAVRGAVAAS